jgi:glycosyltransferase involved in cell wall biosynthesis
MRICFDVGPALQGRAGLGRYAAELLAALLRVGPEHQYIGFHNRGPVRQGLDRPLAGLPQHIVPLSNVPWRLGTLPAYLLGGWQDRRLPACDIFHATDQLLPRLRQARSVFTLYDVAFALRPETHTRPNRWFLSLMIPRFLRAADAVIAISECSKRDAVRLYGIEPSKIRVIYLAADARFRPASPAAQAAARSRYELPARYILFVGAIEPRKNLSMLLDAYAPLLNDDPELRLVIAGPYGWLYAPFLKRLDELGLRERVYFPGWVAGEDLPALYAAAEAFVYPSLYEGFGLPALEALACGTPVVCSDASSLPEVAGDAALLVAPEDAAGWTAALRRVLSDGTLRSEMRARGLRQAARFSWDKTARQTLAVYRELI